ncbi:hypothetical protein [Tateyamaria pelophila]|uniref:hypothetical protein n=1 Tax=Tateyamaria pelophila TaxID=328415 RepID=UPI001CBD8AB6|nr:hypothetical protein [Tateyamaria pelophila]
MDDHPRTMRQVPRTTSGTHALHDIQLFTGLFMGSICILLLFAMPAVAQSTATPMPENASAKSYGDGWECDIGYRLRGDACDAVVVPQNAYETNRTYGSGWECLRGFRQSGQTDCVTIAVPADAFLDPSGRRWHCKRGFLKVDDTCQKVFVPANAYLVDTTFGSAWECGRGFTAADDICVAIAVPANAYLNTSSYGRAWTCSRGYIERGGLCEAVAFPANAYFDDATYGKGWKCERGYAANGVNSEAIVIPTNAHLDRSGNRWECDRNFQKSKGLCVLDN